MDLRVCERRKWRYRPEADHFPYCGRPSCLKEIGALYRPKCEEEPEHSSQPETAAWRLLGKGDAVVMAWSEGNKAAMARAQKKPAPQRPPAYASHPQAWMG